MCWSNSATMLCKTPLHEYLSLSSKSGLRLCLTVKATMLYWCASTSTLPADLTSSKLALIRSQANLSFGPEHEALVGKRLNKQIKRFAKLAQENRLAASQWRNVADAAVFLRGLGYRDGVDDDEGMAGVMGDLSLEDTDTVMTGVDSQVLASRSVVHDINKAREPPRAARGRTKAPGSVVSVRMPDSELDVWHGAAAGRNAGSLRNPAAVSTAPSRLRTQEQTRSVRSSPTASTIVPARSSTSQQQSRPAAILSFQPTPDEAAQQLWRQLYSGTSGSWDGLDAEQVEFEKCLRLEDLGMKIALEAETRMKEMTLRRA